MRYRRPLFHVLLASLTFWSCLAEYDSSATAQTDGHTNSDSDVGSENAGVDLGPSENNAATSGELFYATDTQRLGTLLGYGRIMSVADADANVSSREAGGDILFGTDIGIPVTMENSDGNGLSTYFFFGDTDLLDAEALAEGVIEPYVADGTHLFGPNGVIQGDALAVTSDDNPDDGIQLSHVFRNQEGNTPPVCNLISDEGFRPLYVDGVHTGPCEGATQFNTPTGAFSVGDLMFMVTAIHSQMQDGHFTAESYLSFSSDRGLSWTVFNDGQPLSSAELGGGVPKFVHVSAVLVDASDYQDPDLSGPCYLPVPAEASSQGLLLFGTGAWAEGSNVFLGFLPLDDLMLAVANPSENIEPWYFAGTNHQGDEGLRCWTRAQAESEPVVITQDARAAIDYESPCGYRVIENSGGAGYVTVFPLRQTLEGDVEIDRLLMMYGSGYRVCVDERPGCCGSGESGDGTMCHYSPFGTAGTMERSFGTSVITGERLRPWIWNITDDVEAHNGTLPTDGSRTLLQTLIPPDPEHVLYGSGPACTSVIDDTGVLYGYAPLPIERYTRGTQDQSGIDLYFVISRSHGQDYPGQILPTTYAYNYIVDVFRTTLRLDALEPD